MRIKKWEGKSFEKWSKATPDTCVVNYTLHKIEKGKDVETFRWVGFDWRTVLSSLSVACLLKSVIIGLEFKDGEYYIELEYNKELSELAYRESARRRALAKLSWEEKNLLGLVRDGAVIKFE